MQLLRFNDIPIGTVFCHPEREDWTFVKFANADPRKPPHEQAPNSVGLFNNHYFSIKASSSVIIVKEPADYDDTRLDIC